MRAWIVLAMVAAPAHAEPRWESYARFGGLTYDSSERYFDGLGGGPGARLHLDEQFALQADAQWLTRLGNVVGVSVGAQYQLRQRGWRPAAALRLAGYTGGQLRFVRTGDSRVPAPIVGVVSLEVAPLRFACGGVHATALGIGVGLGFDGGRALALTILEVGVTL